MISEYEKGYNDGLQAAAEAAQPTRLTHLVAVERDTRQKLEAVWARMKADPTEITKDQLRELIVTDYEGRDASPIKPLEEASEAYFADVNARAAAEGKSCNEMSGDPALFSVVLDALEDAQTISGAHREYRNRALRALKGWISTLEEVYQYAKTVEPYNYYNAKAYTDVAEHYSNTHQ